MAASLQMGQQAWSPSKQGRKASKAAHQKQEPLGKWSKVKTRARSRSKLAVGRRVRESQGTSGAQEVQMQQAGTEL